MAGGKRIYGGRLSKGKGGKFDISFLGDKDLKRRFDTLGVKMQKKYLRKALRAGAKPIQQQWKANVPVDTGAYKSGIRVRAMKRSRRGLGILVQSPTRKHLQSRIEKSVSKGFASGESLGSLARRYARVDELGSADGSYYPALVEFGSTKRGIPAGGHGRRAFQSMRSRAVKIIAYTLWGQMVEGIRQFPSALVHGFGSRRAA